MKTRVPSVLLLAAALSMSALVPLSAAPAPQGVVPMIYTVRSVTVVRGEVTDIKLVNDHAAELIAAHVKVKAAGMIAASK
jgi:hypothetical protein